MSQKMTDEELDELLKIIVPKRRDEERKKMCPTPQCPSSVQIRSVWMGQTQWTTEQQQHIDSCLHCQGVIPITERFLATLPKEISHKPIPLQVTDEPTSGRQNIL